MKLYHTKRSQAGLIKFRFSIRISGPIPDRGYIVELHTSKHHLTLVTGKDE